MKYWDFSIGIIPQRPRFSTNQPTQESTSVGARREVQGSGMAEADRQLEKPIVFYLEPT
jgi:hypothetical protein